LKQSELFGNVIASTIYESIDDDGFKWLQLDNILDHIQQSEDDWYFLVQWKDGDQDVVSLRNIKESYPVHVADYVFQNKLSHLPVFS